MIDRSSQQGALLPTRIEAILSAKITRMKHSQGFGIQPDIRACSRKEIKTVEIKLKAYPNMRLERINGLTSYRVKNGEIELLLDNEGRVSFETDRGRIEIYADGRYVGSSDGLFFEGKAKIFLHPTRSTEKSLTDEPRSRGMKEILLPIAILSIMLVWIGFTFDILQKNPFLSVALVLGALALILGRALNIGDVIKIRKNATTSK